MWSGHAFDWGKFGHTFRALNPFWMLAAILFALSTYWGRALRWRVLIRKQKPHASLWSLFVATAIGFTAIVVFGRPGEMIRPYLIAKKEKLPISSQVGAWFLERLYDLLMALLIFGVALMQVQSTAVEVGEALAWVLRLGGHAAGALATVCIVLLAVFGLFSGWAEKRLRQAAEVLPASVQGRVQSMVSAFVQGIQSTSSASAILQVVAYSVLEWLLIIGCYYCLFLAVPQTAAFTLLDVSIFVGFVAFGSVVQIPGVGGGPQIVSVIILTQLFRLSMEVASGVALLLWVVTFVVIVPFGLLLAVHEGIRFTRLAGIGDELAEEGLTAGAIAGDNGEPVVEKVVEGEPS
ncbi:MAG: flippase-like domain-containing protein [Bryobacterales bacterium]|nr:flippase-like domain-containing protein [Bryobacterales bacterium]